MINNKETFEETLARIKKEHENITQCLEIANEFDRMCAEQPEILKNIFLEGTRTEFWKYFKAVIVRQLYLADQNLRTLSVNNVDDLLKYNHNRMIYQESHKWLNFPITLLKTLFEQFAANNAKNQKQ